MMAVQLQLFLVTVKC